MKPVVGKIEIGNRSFDVTYSELNQLMSEKTKKKLINVFVPTTPNPTSGFLLMVPEDEIIYLDLNFEEASKFIVSAGTSSGKN